MGHRPLGFLASPQEQVVRMGLLPPCFLLQDKEQVACMCSGGTDLPLHVGMAELVDALGLGSSVFMTWRFKSSYRHLGELAQLVERLLCKQDVSGSSPLFSINGLATSVLTSPREKRIGNPTHVRERWGPSWCHRY